MKFARLLASAILTIACTSAAFAADMHAGHDMSAMKPGLVKPAEDGAAKAALDTQVERVADLEERIWSKTALLDALVDAGKAEKREIKDLVSEISSLRVELRKAERVLNKAADSAGMGGCPCMKHGKMSGMPGMGKMGKMGKTGKMGKMGKMDCPMMSGHGGHGDGAESMPDTPVPHAAHHM